MALPICPWCGEPGLHIDSAACLIEQQDALRLLRAQAALADSIRTPRTRALQYLRRDRCDLPTTNVTKKI